MDIVRTLEADAAAAWSAVQHGAAWLLGAAAVAERDVQELEKDDPMVETAVKAGIAVAVAHGVPVAAVETMADDVLALARKIAAPPAGAAP